MDYEIIFKGDLQEMSADEIINHVDPATYNQIKRFDKTPLFKVFSLGHEGESEGKVLGVGNVVKKWVKNVIQMMHDKLKLGTKVFLHHNKDNTHSGRLQLGKLVGKAVEILSNGLNALGIVYIDPEHREFETDVASIEAKFTWNPFTKEIKGISDITGIALGNSDNMEPGFKGAILQAQLQEFHDSHVKDGIGVIMTLEEIKAAIKAGKYTVEDCHDRPEIENVEFVKGYKAANKRVYEKKQELEDKVANVDTMKTEFETKITERDTIIAGYKKGDSKRAGKKILDEVLKERTTITDKQRDFTKDKWDDFSIQDPEKAKEEINKFVDTSLTDFKRVSKIMGVETEDPKDPPKDPPPGAKPFIDKSTGIEYDEKGHIKGDNRFLNAPKTT